MFLAKETLIGWYSTGPRLRTNDLDINRLFGKYTKDPILVIIDVQPKEAFMIPTKAYVAVEEVKEGGTETPRISFQHITSEIGALEAEEVGVEHLLRDLKDTSVSTLATQIHNKLLSLKSMSTHLHDIQNYLDNVVSGKLPLNHEILGHLQDIFNLAPNLNIEETSKSFTIKTNDMMLVIYLASLIRSVIALHSLINNKLENREVENPQEKKVENPQEKKVENPEKKVENPPEKKVEEPSKKKLNSFFLYQKVNKHIRNLIT